MCKLHIYMKSRIFFLIKTHFQNKYIRANKKILISLLLIEKINAEKVIVLFFVLHKSYSCLVVFITKYVPYTLN